MKNLFTYFALGAIFFIGSYFIFQIEGLPSIGYLFLQIILLGAYFIGVYLFTGADSTSKLAEKIGQKLTDLGYDHGITEGIAHFKKQGYLFDYHIFNTSNDNIKKLYFFYDFSIDDIEKSPRYAYGTLTDYININHPYTTMTTLNGGFRCRYECAINSTDDFMQEMNVGCDAILEAVRDFYENVPQCHATYPNNEKAQRKVGFNVDENHSEEAEQLDIVAQTETETK